MTNPAAAGADRGNDTRRKEKAEGIAFARGWRAGFNAGKSFSSREI